MATGMNDRHYQSMGFRRPACEVGEASSLEQTDPWIMFHLTSTR